MGYGIRRLLEMQLRLTTVFCRISSPEPIAPGAASWCQWGGGMLCLVLFRFPICLHHINCSLKLALKCHVGAALTSVLLMLSLVGFAVQAGQ